MINNKSVQSVGIIVPHLGINQFNYSILCQVNNMTTDEYNYDFCIFCEHQSIPFMQCMCPIFCISSIKQHNDILLSCDIHTTYRILDCDAQKIHLYFKDLSFLSDYKLKTSLLSDIIEDNRVCLWSRNKFYCDIIGYELNTRIYETPENNILKNILSLGS